MSAFNEGFLNEISYRKRPLNEFIQSFIQAGEFGVFSSFFLQGLGSATSMTDCKSKLLDMDCFSNEELSFIIEYFSSLGKGDSVTQKQYFTAIKSSLNEYMDRAKDDCKRYGKLYIQLGFLCGLTILILII
jgi:stage III sporulation protein AB